jgi:hypothetical protein
MLSLSSSPELEKKVGFKKKKDILQGKASAFLAMTCLLMSSLPNCLFVFVQSKIRRNFSN